MKTLIFILLLGAHCGIKIDTAPALAEAEGDLAAYEIYTQLPDIACSNPDPEGFWRDFTLRVRNEVCHPAWEATTGAAEPCSDPDNAAACAEEKEKFVEKCGVDLTAKAKERGRCP